MRECKNSGKGVAPCKLTKMTDKDNSPQRRVTPPKKGQSRASPSELLEPIKAKRSILARPMTRYALARSLVVRGPQKFSTKRFQVSQALRGLNTPRNLPQGDIAI